MIITISGDSGAGKSTVAKLVAKKLDYKHYSSGDFFRQIAQEKGMDFLELNKQAETDRDLNNEIDQRTIDLGKTQDNFVADGRLVCHLIPKSFKIFLTVSSDIAAKRIYNQKRTDESGKSEEEMKKEIEWRQESLKSRFIRLYNFDYTDEKNYDLVIDTNNITAEQVAQQVFDKLPSP